MIRIKGSRREEERIRKEKRKFFVVLGIILIVLLIIKGLLFGPLSDSKAIERTKTNIKNGAYCSGFNNNNADGTRIVVFRDNETNEVVDSFEVSWSIAEKIYYKEV